MNTNQICPECGSEHINKNGHVSGKQRYRCMNPDCGHQFVSIHTKLLNAVFSDNHKVKIDETGNERVVNITTDEFKDIETILTESNIDLKIWKIDKFTIDKFSKIINDEVLPFTNVKASLSKIVPDIQKFPVVKPIMINSTKYKSESKPSNKRFKKALILPDSQVGFARDMMTGYLDPFHSRPCLDIILKLVSENQFDTIVLLGDMLDFPEQSEKFIKRPEFFFTTQASLVELGWWISQLRLLNPSAKIVYLKGNHCLRLENSIINNSIWAYGLKPFNKLDGDPALSVENLLSLKELDVTFIKDYPNGEYWLNDNLKIIHGSVVKQGSGSTTRELLRHARASVIQGHVHRMETASATTHNKDKIISYTAASMGCLCRLDNGIVPATAIDNNWQNGFGVVNYEDGNGLFQIHSYSINSGAVLFNDKVITGDEKSYLKQLRDDTKWNF